MTPDEEVPQHIYALIREETEWEGEGRITYGIAVYESPRTAEGSGIVATIRDITPNRVALEKLICRCNEGALSPVHLQDIVDDFLDA